VEINSPSAALYHGNPLNSPDWQLAHSYPVISLSPWVDAFTDSGYGSNGLAKAVPSCLETIEEDVQKRPLENEPQNEPSLLQHGINTHTKTRQYAETVYSDTESLQNPKFHEYAVAFADELSNSLPAEFSRNDIQNISTQLPSILRSFASRIAYETPVYIGNPVKHLVDRYRLYIFPTLVV